ncbi:MAG: PP2C family protein-serine/threonine phosphatase [Jatrophihabitans sp.]|uniref:PP2C family protein-serine/threonine phosphatase n=1 Tax=Jatrophihabitans sp. TaxID=1932789 RepID=UPI003F7D5C37
MPAPVIARGRLRVSAIALVVGVAALVVSIALSVAAFLTNDHTENRLLHLKVAETGTVFQTALPSVATPLVAAAEFAHGTPAEARAAFRQFARTAVGGKQPFVSMTLWDLTGSAPRLVATVGSRPRLAGDLPTLAALFRHETTQNGISVIGLLTGQPRRLGYAYAVAGDHPDYVVYAESMLPASTHVPTQPGTPFSDLNYRLYVGRKPVAANLLTTNVDELGSRTASVTVPFGDSAFTLVGAPRVPLAGALANWLWLIILIAGIALSLVGGVVAERLARRRAAAEQLAADVGALLERQRAVTTALQEAMIPATPPALPGAELAVRYLPSADDVQIGGDWYDAQVIEGGRLFLSIGDVSGRGIGAGTVMASLRTATQAFVSEGNGPAEVLDRLNRLPSIRTSSHFATILCVQIDLERRRLCVASAGHLPAVMLSALGPALLEVEPGPPVGVLPKPQYREDEHELPDGATMLLFTDGLVERRGEPIDVGLARLVAACREVPCALDELLDGLIRTLRAEAQDDDTAVMAVRLR